MNGKYLFQNLAAGSYKIIINKPTDMQATIPNAHIDSLDSDIINDTISNIALADNTIDSSFDAGFHNTCSGVLRGNVWHDIDAMTDNYVDSAGSSSALNIPNGLRISLVSIQTDLVVKTTIVNGLGTFTLANVSPGTYYLVLSKFSGVIGQNAPPTILPLSWTNTGEKLGTTAGRDAQVNGILNVTFRYDCVYNANFGILSGARCVCID